MSREAAEFLLSLVNNLTLNVGAADFEETLSSVLAARQELQEILKS